jgi:hypothetical protein
LSTVVGMSDADDRAPLRYETIIIVGGGCYGGYYVRQLHRAARAGAVIAESIVVVDRDAECAVAVSQRKENEENASPIPTRIRVEDWRTFFRAYLDRAAAAPSVYARDAIVPSPLMPHLMAEWLVERAVQRWPDRSVATAAVGAPLPVPWQRAGADGTYYVSFADWICPINCIEPRTCPVTKGPRDWSLPPTVAAYASVASAASAVMHCRHRTFGVGMFDTAEVLAADATIQSSGDDGAAEVIVGTTSHCHGALTRLVIGPRASRG